MNRYYKSNKRKRATPGRSYGKKSRYSYLKPKISMHQLPKCIKPEMKQVSANIEGGTLSSLTEEPIVLKPLSNLAHGSYSYSRIGNKVCLHGIHIKGHFENRSSPANTLFVRLAVLRDRQQDSLEFDGTRALMKGNTIVGLGSLGAESAYLSWNKERYEVVHSQVIKVAADLANGSNFSIVNKFVKMGNKEIVYDHSLAVPNAIVSGNYQVICWAVDPDNAGQNTSLMRGYLQATAFYTDP